ncbi:hypothetical protein [Ruminiclostridium papyrosolvens]|uniref:ABC transporter permease n=1 Tax=Ruminiclostridium papyrosolvens C7 TaxID=1330534 RepID=U4QYY3_9FIRM|nr:hypothetical protein [Ruminiclostridium papyrosolvens]EPR10078.1 hypothetical protein L323_14975 [Ruminiclostridium papyrosolvens C7]
MLKRNNKTMFFILLIPVYFVILLCFFGISVGGVEWILALECSILFFWAAWSLSRNNNLIINLTGFMIYAIMGGKLIYSTLTNTDYIGPWTLNIYVGAALLLFGLLAFAFATVRFVKGK